MKPTDTQTPLPNPPLPDGLKEFFEAQKATARALCDEGKFEEAIAAYRQTPGLVAEKFSTELPDTNRAELLLLLGRANNWPDSSRDEIACQRRQQAIAALREAFQIYTREDFPQE